MFNGTILEALKRFHLNCTTMANRRSTFSSRYLLVFTRDNLGSLCKQQRRTLGTKVVLSSGDASIWTLISGFVISVRIPEYWLPTKSGVLGMMRCRLDGPLLDRIAFYAARLKAVCVCVYSSDNGFVDPTPGFEDPTPGVCEFVHSGRLSTDPISLT